MALYRIDIQFIILVWTGTGTKINISGQKNRPEGGVVFFLGVNLKLRYPIPPVHNLNEMGRGKSYREGSFYVGRAYA
jgi:hypothetical protein